MKKAESQNWGRVVLQVMTTFTLALGAIAFLLPERAHAMGAKPAKLSVDEVSIFENLNLRDTKGQIFTLEADRHIVRPVPQPGDVDTGVIPAAGSEELCGSIDGAPIDLLLRKVRAQSDLAQILMALDKRQPRTLTDSERQILSGVPLCEPYLDSLVLITKLLKNEPDQPETPAVKKIDEIVFSQDSKLKTGVLQMSVQGHAVQLLLNGKVDIDSNGHPIGLAQLSATPNSSGQGVGVQIKLVDLGDTTDHPMDTTESCSETSYRRVWRDGKECEESYTWYGHRSVHYIYSSSIDRYTMNLMNRNNQPAATLSFDIFNSDDGPKSYGPCVPDSWDRSSGGDPWHGPRDPRDPRFGR